MDLKEYIKIIKDNIKVFLGVVIAIILIVVAYFLLRPISYNVSLNFDITRTGKQNTQDYQYDDFYRLQADEKFAETLVQWLKAPGIVSEILREAKIPEENLSIRNLAKTFEADKFSPQVVSVSFSTQSKKEAQEISQAISSTLESNINKLNQEQKQENWFKIVPVGPTVRLNTVNWPLTVTGSVLAGIFIAFLSVLITHYFKKEQR